MAGCIELAPNQDQGTGGRVGSGGVNGQLIYQMNNAGRGLARLVSLWQALEVDVSLDGSVVISSTCHPNANALLWVSVLPETIAFNVLFRAKVRVV